MEKIKSKEFYPEHLISKKRDIKSRKQVCNFINKNKVEVVAIVGEGYNFILFYREKKWKDISSYY